MSQDIALFLDLDNVLIGANEAGLPFDIDLILSHVKSMSEGRIVFRRAYGDYRQNLQVPRQLVQAGFELQSVVRLNHTDKNLADIQMVAEAIETLVDGYGRFGTYVLITGDRDFMPLVQVLRRHNKVVIGIGVRHTAHSSLIDLCDRYVFYDEITQRQLAASGEQMRDWMVSAAEKAFQHQSRIQASLFRNALQAASNGEFATSAHGKQPLAKVLALFPDIVTLERDGTTLYVHSARVPVAAEQGDAYLKYRSNLKRHGLRVVAAPIRLAIMRDALNLIRSSAEPPRWQEIVEKLFGLYGDDALAISKSMINDVLRVARRAEIIALPEVDDKPLAAMPVSLRMNGDRMVQNAILRCDRVYLSELQKTFGDTFDLVQAAMALYDSAEKAPYLQFVLSRADDLVAMSET